MLLHARDLIGRQLVGTDGIVGKVKDLFFADDGWSVRYLVIDTGTWLSSREVLVSPVSLLRAEGAYHPELKTRLSREQVEKSPPVLADAPVSRLYEEQLHDFYGWPYYWAGTAFGGPSIYMSAAIGDVGAYPWASTGQPPDAQLRREERDAMEQRLAAADPHLRSCKEVTGYAIHATDGEIGHVDDFLISDPDWLVTNVVIDTRNWLPGKRVTIDASAVEHIDWQLGEVCVSLSKSAIKDRPAGPSDGLVARESPRTDGTAGSDVL